jgi:replicative DNA helicase Mcm
MVLSSDGLICIDEMDKMSNEDRAAMHEALENQTVSISKANIQATLIARTTVLAAANPKFGRFDPYGIISEQIDLPPTLINRFDLIFPIKDLPEEVRDEKLAKHILSLHQKPDLIEAEIDTNMLKKFVGYARQNCHPQLTDGAIEEIKEFYLKMRKGGGEGGVKTVPISARQLEALVRLSEASARSRLDSRVTRKDAKKAIEMLDYCLMQVGFDKETGKIDIDRIATGVGASQRSHIIILKEVVAELEAKLGKAIPIEEVVNEAKSRGLDEDKIEEALERLKRSGDVFEPKRGFLSRI